MTLKVVVVDDERIARARLVRLLSAIEDVEIVAECDRGDTLGALLRQTPADVLLLDVEMPGLRGTEALRLLPEPRPWVIFCTAYAEHAVFAFDVGAVDYLLKPVEAGRLATAIDRAKRAIGDAPRERAAWPHRLPIETREGVLLLDPAEISHAELDDALVTVHAGGRRVLTELSLSTLEARLPAGKFVRVHRRALLNLDHVAVLEPTTSGGYLARTKDGHGVEVSRHAARQIRKALGIGRGGPEDR